MSINVQLPKFEGPLGLLLYLIRKEEMDIMDIKIHEITRQYFEYIKLMRELDLEVAGEFVAMASTLIQIKSRMLLPQYNDQGEVIETEDPRQELVQKLLEYQKYQEAAKLLYDRPLVGRDLWLRGTRESLDQAEEEIILEENALFSLISSYRRVLRSVKKKVHQVAAKAQSIASRVLELKDRLIVGHRVTLMDLVTNTEERARQALITFLSLLELGKMGFVGLYQSEPYSDIWVETKKPIESDVITRVEEYDSMRADQIAEQMMEDAKKIDLQDELLAATNPEAGTLSEAPTVSIEDLLAETQQLELEANNEEQLFLENQGEVQAQNSLHQDNVVENSLQDLTEVVAPEAAIETPTELEMQAEAFADIPADNQSETSAEQINIITERPVSAESALSLEDESILDILTALDEASASNELASSHPSFEQDHPESSLNGMMDLAASASVTDFDSDIDHEFGLMGSTDQIATDDDILAAENELFKNQNPEVTEEV